jgi:hypothetical protein
VDLTLVQRSWIPYEACSGLLAVIGFEEIHSHALAGRSIERRGKHVNDQIPTDMRVTWEKQEVILLLAILYLGSGTHSTYLFRLLSPYERST